jgi:hypothetical protein
MGETVSVPKRAKQVDSPAEFPYCAREFCTQAVGHPHEIEGGRLPGEILLFHEQGQRLPVRG